MGQLIRINKLTFSYPGTKTLALEDIQFSIQKGDFLVLAGTTGSGKTTLLKQLKQELLPAGQKKGEVLYKGQAIADIKQTSSAQEIGFVAQNPQMQPIMATVIEELAFPLENLGYSSDVINSRIAELANFLGLDKFLTRSIKTLSGGQVQLVNLASVLALKPEIILLDEPTAQLDPTTAQNFLNVLRQVHDELGTTIVLTEHRLSRVLGLANRLVVLQAGKLLCDGSVSEGLRKMAKMPELSEFVPPIPHFFLQHRIPVATLPLSIPAGRHLLVAGGERFRLKRDLKPQLVSQGIRLLAAKNITLDFNGHVVLRHLNLELSQGDWLAIIGKNGSGKSTLLSVLAGLLKPQHGKVRLKNQVVWKLSNQLRLQKIAYLSQNPLEQFSGKTVREELEDQNRLTDEPFTTRRIVTLMTELQLTDVANHNVFDLSGGQQQLLGLGICLVTQPKVLLLDEPTKGLDPTTKEKLGTILKRVHAQGTTIVMASHDMNFCARYAKQCTFMFNGQVNPPVTSRKFFTQNFIFTTAINRLLANQVPTALFADDVTKLTTVKGGEQSDDAQNRLA